MAASFTVAECDAEIVRLKASYDKLSHMESYGAGGRQALHRKLKEIRDEIVWWQAQRNGTTSGGAIRNRGAVPA